MFQCEMLLMAEGGVEPLEITTASSTSYGDLSYVAWKGGVAPYTVKANGSTVYTGSDLAWSGSVSGSTVTFSVTDKRNHTVSKTVTKPVCDDCSGDGYDDCD